MKLDGKEVLTQDTFSYEDVRVGDYVEQAVVAYSMRKDPATGRWRNTYQTFRRITSGSDGIWQYCGHCFCGENQERGVNPADMNMGYI